MSKSPIADCRRIAFAGKAAGSDVGKRHVAIVAKQAIMEFQTGLSETRNGSAIGEEDIRAAVVVVIESGDAAARQFDLMILA